MTYLILALLSVTIALLFVILLRISKAEHGQKIDLGPVNDSLRRIESNEAVINNRMTDLDRHNTQSLEAIRQTVDEKLQGTLERRLSSSFKQVGDQLESVYRQLGEVQALAHEIGSLQKILTNVKTRGAWGELQAERILQELLTPDQYVRNEKTKRGSNDMVEFAVKLPEGVLLPIDSKFPREDYDRLCSTEDPEQAKALRKSLASLIVKEAKDIHDKYIDVPNTTDFGILFLPLEGLFAEVLSVPGLMEHVQHTYHVMIAGPTTLASLLNSLQMGFRTLAIEKRASDVWKILGEVKTEYCKFGQSLEAIKKKLSMATDEIDSAFTRHRAMERRLRGVEAMEIEDDRIEN